MREHDSLYCPECGELGSYQEENDTPRWRDEDDVKRRFEERGGFTEGERVEELVVESIDYILTSVDHGDGLEAEVYVYFNPVGHIRSAWVGDDDIAGPVGWSRDSIMIGDRLLGVKYTYRIE